MFRACLLPDSGRAQEKILDHYNMTIQKSHKMLRCPAKLQSVVAKFSGQIFYKNKIFNFVFIEIVSVAFTFFLFKISTQFPMSRQIFLHLGLVPKWPRNLKNLNSFWTFWNQLFGHCCTFYKSSDLKNIINPMKSFTQFGCAQLRLLESRGESDNFDFSLTSESTYYSMKIWRPKLSFMKRKFKLFRGGNLWCNDKLKQKFDDVFKARATLHMIFASHRGAIPKN